MPNDILISVEPRHVRNFLQGKKTVELRRRRIPLARGNRVWMYSKLPAGQVEAFGIVAHVLARPPKEIWKDYGPDSGISSDEFDRYFRNLELGYVIVFQEIRRVKRTLSLSNLRRHLIGFHPPQFFKWLHADGPEIPFFRSALV